MKCHYCGEKITLFQRFRGRVRTIKGSKGKKKLRLHEHCSIEHNISQFIETLFKSQKSIHMNVVDISKNLNDHNRSLHTLYEQIMTMILQVNNWLLETAARREDVVHIGVFDPILMKLVLKYSGMSIDEVLKEIKNKETKRMLNNLKKEIGK